MPICQADACHQEPFLEVSAILSLGLLNDDDSPMFDLPVLPWSADQCPTALKMTAKELHAEVTWHSIAAENVLHAPRPSQWTVARATDRLINNPIIARDKVVFI